ncbi:hypothetical protein FS842_008466 [Serendipita sp. 407]|nr:hypothetical protein FS842_008466 [Serendipita sp. 407]
MNSPVGQPDDLSPIVDIPAPWSGGGGSTTDRSPLIRASNFGSELRCTLYQRLWPEPRGEWGSKANFHWDIGHWAGPFVDSCSVWESSASTGMSATASHHG